MPKRVAASEAAYRKALAGLRRRPGSQKASQMPPRPVPCTALGFVTRWGRSCREALPTAGEQRDSVKTVARAEPLGSWEGSLSVIQVPPGGGRGEQACVSRRGPRLRLQQRRPGGLALKAFNPFLLITS